MKTMRKLISVILCMLMVLSTFGLSMTVFAREEPVESGNCGDGASYTLGFYTHTLEITGNGKIDDGVFKDRSDIKSVVIGNEITEIGNNTFDGCRGITEVDLGGVLTIGKMAFQNCYYLTDVYSEKVATISGGAFAYCHRLNSDIPGSVKRIENYAFAGCSAFENINIPQSVEYIGEGAFSNCLNLETAFIPETVKQVGPFIFSGDISLKRVSDYSMTATCFSGDEDSEFAYNALKRGAPMTAKHLAEVSDIFDENNCYSDNYFDLEAVLDEIYDKTGVRYTSYSDFRTKFRDCIDENTVPYYLTVECLEKSAQHEQCISDAVNHNIISDYGDFYAKDCDLKCGNHLDVYKNDNIEPTCISRGYKGGTVCLICAEKDDEERIAASVIEPAEPYGEIQPHTPAVLPGVEASCTETGFEDTVICAVCGKALSDVAVIPPTGHDDKNGDGFCDECGEPFSQPDNDKKPTILDQIVEFFANSINRIIALFKKIFG